MQTDFGSDLRFSFNSPDFQSLAQFGWASEDISKALTTGSGVVQIGDSGGRALRVQALAKKLEQVSFSQDDARTFKIIPKKKATSTTEEWTNFQSYGGVGDGFVGETGATGAFDVASADDNFTRQVAIVKYLATERTISVVAGLVQNIENPMTVAETGATLNLISKANLAFFNGNSLTNSLSYNGFDAQCIQWLENGNGGDASMLVDMGGAYIDQAAIQETQLACSQLYGNPSLLLTSSAVRADLNKALFPQGRYTIGNIEMNLGTAHNKFDSDFGPIKLEYDKMLRVNKPLVADGPAVSGKPRASVAAGGVAAADAGSLAFAVTPFVSSAAGSAGTGNFWRNYTFNTDATAPAAPALPSGNNNSNRLAAAGYLYGISSVFGGLESAMWVYGAATVSTVAGATTVSPTSGQIVTNRVDLTTPCITGLGSTYARANVKFRIYRAPAGATSFLQFDLVGETGCPISGDSYQFDNGYTIPGTDTAYMITEQKNGIAGWGFWQLLPIMKREMPHLALADLFVYMLFGTPILRVPRHNVIIRNIGRWTAS